MELKLKYRDVAYGEGGTIKKRGEEQKRFRICNQAKLSIVIYPGIADSEIEPLWAFIKEAIQKGLTIISREDGYYILSRDVNGSKPHTSYECVLKNDKETEILINLLEKHLKGWLKK